MGKIRILPSEVVSKIAAGEVIERPAFAVKELLENSIDAGASFIKIEIEENGLKKISITDNGEGMDQADLKNCYLPHSTSKLEEDNLVGIKTLGFRGEALSSIAAISRLSILSRRKEDSLGATIEILQGKVVNDSKSGAPPGTKVTVESLFSNVPARKKFLKSKRTEFRHILEIITDYALAYLQIRFEFYQDKKLIFDLPQGQKITERIKNLLGQNIGENLIPINYEESYVKVSGFLCKPQIGSTNSERQHLFINNRRVANNLISSAIKDGYGGLLEPNIIPVFILFVEIPKELVDVNVHPRKEQVNFFDNEFIFNTFQKATTQTLTENNLTFYNLSWKGTPFSGEGKTNSYLGKLLKEEVLPSNYEDLGKINLSGDIIQVHNLYLLCQTKQGIILIDQHAAHERILFEKFKETFLKHKKNKESLELEKAILFELSPADSQVLLDNLQVFKDLGFILEEFGDNTFKIEAIPTIFKDWDTVSIIRETIDDLLKNGVPKDIDSQSRKMIAYLACRSAIKSGDKLTKKQIKDLIRELRELDLNYTCPHGRPLKVEIPLYQLDKLFRRK